MRRLVVAWRLFTEAFLFLLYVTEKNEVLEQSGCKLRFRCNKQKNNYLHWLDFSNCNNDSF